MRRRWVIGLVFAAGFLLLLVDGAALVWLGQLLGRPILIIVGVVLLLASAGIVIAWRRWIQLLEDVEAERRGVKDAIKGLRDALSEARQDRWKS